VNPARHSTAGVTLIEMLIVVTLIGLLAGITFPSVSSGLDTLRLNQATNQIVSFFNEALNRAERREQVVEITVLQAQNALLMHSAESGFERRLDLPRGISIVRVLPEREQAEGEPRQFVLFPGGVVPRAGIEIVNSRKTRRIVRVDPITGVPQIERIENP
jgi:prepilin-type N-terminal cleavage/methylation domain-containing protein